MELRAETSVFDDKLLKEDIDNAQETADNAQVIAGTTAQYFWFLEEIGSVPEGVGTGAHITNLTKEEFLYNPANGGGNLLARSNGIAIRDGLTELAYFSGTAAQIGKSDSYNTYFDSQSFQIRSGSTELAYFSGTAAQIGKSNDYNTYFDSQSFQIRSGSTELARFKSGGIDLGLNSLSSALTMCGEIGKINANERTEKVWEYDSETGEDIFLGYSTITRLDIYNQKHLDGAYDESKISIGIADSESDHYPLLMLSRNRWDDSYSSYFYVFTSEESDLRFNDAEFIVNTRHDFTVRTDYGEMWLDDYGITLTAVEYSQGQARIQLSSNGIDFGLHLGTGGKNHGVYSWEASKWLVYANSIGDIYAGAINVSDGWSARTSMNACGKFKIHVQTISLGTIASGGKKTGTVNANITGDYEGWAISGYYITGTNQSTISIYGLRFLYGDQTIQYKVRNMGSSQATDIELEVRVLCTYTG